MSHQTIIEKEDVDRCEICGAIAEVRPYGPNGEEVCFQCGMRDEDAARRGFSEHVMGQGRRRNKVRKSPVN